MTEKSPPQKNDQLQLEQLWARPRWCWWYACIYSRSPSCHRPRRHLVAKKRGAAKIILLQHVQMDIYILAIHVTDRGVILPPSITIITCSNAERLEKKITWNARRALRQGTSAFVCFLPQYSALFGITSQKLFQKRCPQCECLSFSAADIANLLGTGPHFSHSLWIQNPSLDVAF